MRERRCNRCGKSLCYFDEEVDFSIHTIMGYGSDYDGEKIDLSLCYDCADDLIAECIISPIEQGGSIRF